MVDQLHLVSTSILFFALIDVSLINAESLRINQIIVSLLSSSFITPYRQYKTHTVGLHTARMNAITVYDKIVIVNQTKRENMESNKFLTNFRLKDGL